MPKHTAQSVHELLKQMAETAPVSFGFKFGIPTEQDILDIGLREALRRLYNAGLFATGENDYREYCDILGVRLEDDGGE